MKIHSFKIFLIILQGFQKFSTYIFTVDEAMTNFFFEYFNPKYQPFNGHDKYARENV